MSVVTPEQFWNLFAENLPEFRKDELRECYPKSSEWTCIIFPFLKYLTKYISETNKITVKYGREVKHEEKETKEVYKIDVIFYEEENEFGNEIAFIEHENMIDTKEPKELINLQKIGSSKLKVFIWYYNTHISTWGTDPYNFQDQKNTILKNMKDCNGNGDNWLFILGPGTYNGDSIFKNNIDKYFECIDNSIYNDYIAFTLTKENGELEPIMLDRKEIIRKFNNPNASFSQNPTHEYPKNTL